MGATATMVQLDELNKGAFSYRRMKLALGHFETSDDILSWGAREPRAPRPSNNTRHSLLPQNKDRVEDRHLVPGRRRDGAGSEAAKATPSPTRTKTRRPFWNARSSSPFLINTRPAHAATLTSPSAPPRSATLLPGSTRGAVVAPHSTTAAVAFDLRHSTTTPSAVPAAATASACHSARQPGHVLPAPRPLRMTSTSRHLSYIRGAAWAPRRQ